MDPTGLYGVMRQYSALDEEAKNDVVDTLDKLNVHFVKSANELYGRLLSGRKSVERRSEQGGDEEVEEQVQRAFYEDLQSRRAMLERYLDGCMGEERPMWRVDIDSEHDYGSSYFGDCQLGSNQGDEMGATTAHSD
jgi:hypothetical protein